MLILILCYLIIIKRNISNFTDYKLDYNDLLKIFKIDFIKNNNVDVVCSGPSSKNLVLKSNIVIAVNDSILNKVVNSENNNRKVIWLACKKYHTYNIRYTMAEPSSLEDMAIAVPSLEEMG